MSAVLRRHQDAAAQAGDQHACMLGVLQQRALDSRQHHLRPALVATLLSQVTKSRQRAKPVEMMLSGC